MSWTMASWRQCVPTYLYLGPTQRILGFFLGVGGQVRVGSLCLETRAAQSALVAIVQTVWSHQMFELN